MYSKFNCSLRWTAWTEELERKRKRKKRGKKGIQERKNGEKEFYKEKKPGNRKMENQMGLQTIAT